MPDNIEDPFKNPFHGDCAVCQRRGVQGTLFNLNGQIDFVCLEDQKAPPGALRTTPPKDLDPTDSATDNTDQALATEDTFQEDSGN